MKKLVALFMILLSVLIIGSTTVYAIGDEDDTDNDSTEVTDDDTTDTQTSNSWELDFTTDKFNYTVEGVTLKIYKMDSSKTTTVTETTEYGTSTVSKNEDSIAYANAIPTKTISLNKENYSINPELKNDKLGNTNVSFINLNLNITQEKLESLLQEEIESATDDINYIVEVVLNYKITNYPEKYKYFLNLNTMHMLMSALTSMTGEQISYTPETSLDGSLSQVINIAIINKESENTEAKLYFDSELNDGNNLISYIFNPLILSEEEIELNTSDIDMTNPEKSEYLMFYNVSNIQYLIDNYNKVAEQSNEEAKDQVKDLEVPVPNTALNKSIVWTMTGIISLLTGIMVIMYAKKMKQLRKIEYLGED